jgi:hypothetical protein
VTSPRRAAAGAAACCLLAAGAAPAAACEAVLREHRSGTELMRLPLDAAQPELRIAFEHSVLGTTVVDRYRFTPRPRLVEERFDGQGYGLPHAAGPGETLQRDGAGWRLMLDRAVDPLVVRPLPAQRMRIVLADRELPLATLSSAAIEIAARGCPPPPAS